jgi:CofD-related protein of GAK system
VSVARSIRLPDPVRLARCRRAPELGPRLLFFSGGTALRGLSRELIQYTHNSIHLITPFDSGGSSARLRRAFRMLSVGDLRNRLMALADQTARGQPEIFALFAFRFPKDAAAAELEAWLARMIDGTDPMVAAVADPMRKIIRSHLRFCRQEMPHDFDLRGANIGNLILAGGYLNQNRHIDPVIFLFSRLVEVRGVVRPITSEYLELAAELDDGRTLVGQHLITGKEVPAIDVPIRRVFLTGEVGKPEPHPLAIRDKVRQLVTRAEMICFPMGSFYSSLVANLLPSGVGQAVAETGVPKVFIPNTGVDPEQPGMGVAEATRTLLAYLRRSCERTVSVDELLHFVLVDSAGAAIEEAELEAVSDLGVKVIDIPLVTERSAPLLDHQRLAEVLVSMA